MATVHVELYHSLSPTPKRALDPARAPIDPVDQEIYDIEQEQRLSLAKELGLTGVVEQANRAKLLHGSVINTPYPLLDDEEVRVWWAFLPKAYTTERGRGNAWSVLPIESYAFDQPPISVLEEWKTTRDRKLFDEWEIRTPEQVKRPDPILVGYKHHKTGNIGPFLIARWGESLQDFKQIKKLVAEQRPASIGLQGLQGFIDGGTITAPFHNISTTAITSAATTGGTGWVSTTGFAGGTAHA